MIQDLEHILSQLSQPDNAVIQQVTPQFTLAQLSISSFVTRDADRAEITRRVIIAELFLIGNQ